jgi:hypothetical protein
MVASLSGFEQFTSSCEATVHYVAEAGLVNGSTGRILHILREQGNVSVVGDYTCASCPACAASIFLDIIHGRDAVPSSLTQISLELA